MFETKTISLTQGKVAIVDAADYEWLSQFKWFAYKGQNNRTYYARRNVYLPDGTHRTVTMHHQLLDAQPGQQVDHVDGDGLNNARVNLRLCTASENKRNRPLFRNNVSGYKGVTRHPQCHRWMARIKVDGKSRYLGLFLTAEEAARAYDSAAREMHGEFARLNFGD